MQAVGREDDERQVWMDMAPTYIDGAGLNDRRRQRSREVEQVALVTEGSSPCSLDPSAKGLERILVNVAWSGAAFAQRKKPELPNAVVRARVRA